MNKLIIIFIFLTNLTYAQEGKIPGQKEIIAVLTGEQALPSGEFIYSRSLSDQRAKTRDYLSGIIGELSVEPQLHHYKMPNLNPVIDMLFSPFVGANVYAILPATVETNEYVIIGAHLDSELDCPGAIDNGSGIALAYTAFAEVAKLHYRDKHVILVYFDQEEEELVGSRAFAKWIKKQGFDVHSMHSFDTIGWDADGDLAVEVGFPSPELERIYKSAGEFLNIPVIPTRVVASDDQPFRDLGYDAVGLTDEYVNGDYAPFKDTPQDTYETVNFEFIASSTSLVYEVLKEILKK